MSEQNNVDSFCRISRYNDLRKGWVFVHPFRIDVFNRSVTVRLRHDVTLPIIKLIRAIRPNVL